MGTSGSQTAVYEMYLETINLSLNTDLILGYLGTPRWSPGAGKLGSQCVHMSVFHVL